MTTTYALVAFPDMEELDFVGPWEVFTAAGMNVQASRVCAVAQTRDAVRCAKGLTITPDFDFASAPEADVLLVPGGQGTRRECENPVLLEWLRKRAAAARWVTSVCTGSLVLHAAGLAAGKRITTHWAFVEELRRRAPDATILDDVRFVRDGNLVTSAGVSAGIDMALWLVGQIHDPAHARATQRFIQYDPAPPYAAEV